jgi:transposase
VAPARPTATGAFAEYIATRIAAGEVNAAQLTRELRARGYRGSYQAVRRAVARTRVPPPVGTTTTIDGRDNGEAGRRVAPPSPRQAAWLLRRVDDAPASLRPDEHAYVVRLCAECPALNTARVLATRFATLCRTRDPNGLTPWLEEARGTELHAFVAGIERDRDAVLAAL